jgi:hypothetical protein
MKKLMVVLGVLGMSVLGANAQGNKYGNNDYAYNSKSSKSSNDYNSRATRNDWSYDSHWNRVEGRSGAGMVNSFQKEAREKIGFGIAKGTITATEANKLMKYYEQIERKENRFLRNGRISKSEAMELRRDLDILNRMIARETNDRDFYRPRR